jgi:hypothetical protein
MSSAADEVRRAHKLFHSGAFQEAADAFTKLGEAANRRRLPQDAFLMMQAARAQLVMGNGMEAYRKIKQALSWLQENRRWLVLAKLGSQAASSLDASGYNKEAERIRTLLEQKLPHQNINASMDSTANPANFPEKCPYCGGSIHPELTEDLSDGAVMCAYCGSRIHPHK